MKWQILLKRINRCAARNIASFAVPVIYFCSVPVEKPFITNIIYIIFPLFSMVFSLINSGTYLPTLYELLRKILIHFVSFRFTSWFFITYQRRKVRLCCTTIVLIWFQRRLYFFNSISISKFINHIIIQRQSDNTVIDLCITVIDKQQVNWWTDHSACTTQFRHTQRSISWQHFNSNKFGST